MHEYVQKSYSTTLPRSSAVVIGGELIQSLASNAGAARITGRCVVSTGPATLPGSVCAPTMTANIATAMRITAATR